MPRAPFISSAPRLLRPESDERSVIELQSDEAVYQASKNAATRIFWLAANGQQQDPRLSALVDRLQNQSRRGGRVDLLANQTIGAVKTLVLDRSEPGAEAGAGHHEIRAGVGLPDMRSRRPLSRDTCSGIFVRSVGSEASAVRGRFRSDSPREHYETLKECDGVLIFWEGERKAGCAPCSVI